MLARKYQTYFFIGALLTSTTLTLLVFRAHLVPLAIGAVIAVVARPLYRLTLRFVRSPPVSAFLVITVVLTMAVLPTVLFFAALAAETGQLFGNIHATLGIEDVVRWLERILPASFQALVPIVTDQLAGILQLILVRISSIIFSFFSNVVGVTLGFLVTLVAAYYLLKDGDKIKDETVKLSPLNNKYDQTVLARMADSIRAVIGGLMVIAVIKGITCGLAFWIFGVPAPFFLGTLSGLASFIPLIGSGLIIVPAVLYLIATSHFGAAVGFILVATIIIHPEDNLLQPKLVGDKMKIHPLLVLLSIVGGLEFYGFFGFILGPLTLSVTMALLDIYKQDFRSRLTPPRAEAEEGT